MTICFFLGFFSWWFQTVRHFRADILFLNLLFSITPFRCCCSFLLRFFCMCNKTDVDKLRQEMKIDVTKKSITRNTDNISFWKRKKKYVSSQIKYIYEYAVTFLLFSATIATEAYAEERVRDEKVWNGENKRKKRRKCSQKRAHVCDTDTHIANISANSVSVTGIKNDTPEITQKKTEKIVCECERM